MEFQVLEDLREAFSAMDTDNNGWVHTKDLPTLFSHLNESFHAWTMEADELQRILDTLDFESAHTVFPPGPFALFFQTRSGSAHLPSASDLAGLQSEHNRHGGRAARSVPDVRSFGERLHQVLLATNDLLTLAVLSFCSFDDLWRGMQSLGENLTKHEVEEMMREADRDLDGKITFAEFIEMIRYK